MDQKSRAAELIELINALGYECALVGGLAVSVRTRPRATKDVDVAVAVATDKDAESIGYRLTQAGYTLRDTFESKVTGYISTLRFNHPRDSRSAPEPTIDVLFSSSGIERELVEAATPVRASLAPGIPVARIPHLIALKALSESDERPVDRDDLLALIRAASKAELDEALAAVALIQERGFHRGKDLRSLLREFIRKYQAKSSGT